MIPDADDFTSAVLDVVDSIPAGRVMTYGDVAAVLGSRAARGVGRVMAQHGDHVPWWRVVLASGRAAHGLEQRALSHFRSEGTPILPTDDGYRVDLRKARYLP
jgi:alkylated DNA nucleotide flippase Atl1